MSTTASPTSVRAPHGDIGAERAFVLLRAAFTALAGLAWDRGRATR